MPLSMAARGVETQGKADVGQEENPSWSASTGDQRALTSPEAAIALMASRIAALVKIAQQRSEFTLGTVGNLAGKETPYVSKCLSPDEPHAVLKMLAAVLFLDKEHVWLAGTASLASCDIVERQELSDAEFRRRAEAWARKGKLNAAALAEALKTVPPAGEDDP